MLETLPALSYHFPGITPMAIDDMTSREVNEYLKALKKINEEAT